LIGKFTIF